MGLPGWKESKNQTQGLLGLSPQLQQIKHVHMSALDQALAGRRAEPPLHSISSTPRASSRLLD